MSDVMTTRPPQLTPGKPGTSNADRFFIATFGVDAALDAALKGHGAIELGSRDGAHLWVLPRGVDLEAATAIHAALLTPAHEKDADPVATPEEGKAQTQALPGVEEVSQETVAEPAAEEVSKPMSDPAARQEERVESEAAAKVEEKAPAAAEEEPAAAETAPGADAPAVEKEADEDKSDPDQAEPAGMAPEPAVAAVAPSGANREAVERLEFGYWLGMSVAERDLYRHPLPVGVTSIGDRLMINGVEREIIMLSGPLRAAGDLGKSLEQRFPGHAIAPDSDFQYAMWPVEPEPMPEPGV